MAKKQFAGKAWKDLDVNTQTRYKSLLNQLHKANLTTYSALKMDDLALAKRLQITPRSKNLSKADYEKALIKSAKAYKRVYSQIKGTKERRQNTADLSLKSHKGLGYTQGQYKSLRTQLIKTAGNPFDSIADDLAKLHPSLATGLQAKDGSYIKLNNYTKQLLLIPKSMRSQLSKAEQDILTDYSP